MGACFVWPILGSRLSFRERNDGGRGQRREPLRMLFHGSDLDRRGLSVTVYDLIVKWMFHTLASYRSQCSKNSKKVQE